MRILYRTLIGLCLMALQALGFANQVIKQSAWLEDPTGKWTLQDVQGREFEPYRGLLNKGYSDKALWIRIEIEPGHAPIDQSQDQLPLVLRVRPSFVDDIRLYDGSASAVQIAGDLHSKSTQPYKTLNHNFFVQQGAMPRTLWLRIETTSSRVVHFELLTLQAALAADRAQELFFHVNVSFLLLLTVWAVIQWLASRDKVIGWFAISKMILLVHTVSYFGFPALQWPDWLSPTGPSYLVSLFAILACVAALEFQRHFLSSLKTAKSLLWGMKVVVGLAVLTLLALLLGFERIAVAANSWLLGCATILMFITAMSARIPWLKPKNILPDTYPSKSLLVGTYAVIMVALVFQGLTLVGLIPSEILALNGIVFYGALSSLMMFGLLNMRNRGIQQKHLQTLIDLANVSQGREKERLQREDQEKLFTMLAHEMKTPLATLQMWMDAGKLKRETVERAIHDMNQVIERCVHAGQLSDQGLQPMYETVLAHKLTETAIVNCRSPDRIQVVGGLPLSQISTDAQMFGIVLGNLLDNACKYSPPFSQVHVSLQAHTKDGRAGWLWTIRNHVGLAGMPDPAQLFVKYYRSAHARRQSGSGLGLFLVKRLLELLGGEIWHEPDSERISFCFWLPA